LTNSTTDAAFAFSVKASDGAARLGEIVTPHGVIRTPAFMPCGTAATVKAMYPGEVRALGTDIVLANTYHLMLRPGAERIAELGGLHRFMNWRHPIITDSGGYQVMSLSKLRKIDQRGVTFRSHIDGSKHELTPERAIEIQRLLGTDITMQLDECVALPAADGVVENAMRLSLRWAERSRAAFGAQHGRALFAIVQGGTLERLRVESARTLATGDFHGYAIGGLAVGEPQETMLRMIEATEPHLPRGKPRYLMGVGTPDDIIKAVERGIDMFDCVMPTRAGRHGLAYTCFGKINLRNARHAADARPLDEHSTCAAARDYSRAYLHHLIKAGEILGMMMLTAINIAYYQELMRTLCAAISERKLADEVARVRDGWARGDPI
jgi:queuine tRNA-ribosyltransferase